MLVLIIENHLSFSFPWPSARRSRTILSRRLTSLCGLIAPIFFWIGVSVVGFLQSEYLPLADTVSKMGRVGRPYALIVNGILVLTGIFIAIFALGIPNRHGRKRPSTSMLLAGFGFFGLAGAGLLPCDEICIGTSAANLFHTLPVAIGYICLQLALLQFGNGEERDRFWVGIQNHSITLFWAGLVALLAFVLGRWGVVPMLESYAGFSEKAYLALLFAFIFSLARRLYFGYGHLRTP